MKITILGCGTSTGVPVIGCLCHICRSADPRNNRTRASIFIETEGVNILVDTSTDLRNQALARDISRIDAVLFTHPHADHIHGIDELRTFNMIQGEAAIPCFGNRPTIDRIETIFSYIFSKERHGGWRPNLELSVVDAPFQLSGITIHPITINHGATTILGYRIHDAAYLTDCSGIPESSLAELRGLNTLIVGALRQKPHPSHFSIREALDVSANLAPRRTVFTHLSHTVDYEGESAALPDGVELAYDGMVLEM